MRCTRRASAHTSCFCSQVVPAVTSCLYSHVVLPVTVVPLLTCRAGRHVVRLLTRAARHVMQCSDVVPWPSCRAPAIRQPLAALLPPFPCCHPRRLQHRGRARLPAVPIESSRRPALAAVAPHRVRIRSERASTDSPWEIGRSRLAKDSNGYNVDAYRNPSSLESYDL